jgi:hypothetical protein
LALQDATTAGRRGGDGVSWQTEVVVAASDCSGKAGIMEPSAGDWGCDCVAPPPADRKSSDGSSDAGSGNAGDAAGSGRRRVLMVSSTSAAV